MTTSEKVAYLKGLYDGLAIDPETKEAKLFSSIIDILGDMAFDLEELEENSLDLSEEIDELSEDLAIVEDMVFDEDDEDGDFDEDGGDEGCMCCDCGCEEHEPLFFEVKCPGCENEITIDEDVLELGSIECPNCGESLEFDLSDIEDDFDEDEEE